MRYAIRNKKQRGMSLPEMIISMGLFLAVISGVYMMALHFGSVAKNENSRRRVNQETRYLSTHFAREMEDAGAVLTLADSGAFLGQPIYYTGIYPLNFSKSDGAFADGVIITSGDPEAVTMLEQPFDSSSDTVLSVKSLEVKAHDANAYWENPPWLPGQKGIVLGDTAYYIFSVEDADASNNTITIRSDAVYYSGLLKTVTNPTTKITYEDKSPVKGNTVTYPVRSPVIRLTNFSIYLFRPIEFQSRPNSSRSVRELIRVTDARGKADVLSASGSQSDYSVISESVYDMQVSYFAYTREFFAGATPNTAPETAHSYFNDPKIATNNVTGLLTDMRNKLLKQVTVDFIVLTDDYEGSGTNDPNRLKVPAMGDLDAYNLPTGKYGFKHIRLDIYPANFDICQ